MAVDLARLRRRLRKRYELARVANAALATAILLPVFALVVVMAPRLGIALAGSAVALVVAFLALWWGDALGRGVLPGIVCATFPLASSQIAARIGHICTPDGCVSLCAPLCAVGGVAAGLVLARWIRKERSALMAFASGGLLIVAVGATGCTCVGLGGVAGIALGLGAGLARLVLYRLRPA